MELLVTGLRSPRGCCRTALLTLAVAVLGAPTLLEPAGAALQAQQSAAAPTVAGRLVGPDGTAAADLKVRLIPVPSSYLRRLRELGVSDAIPVVDRTRSDADGRFELSTSRVGPHQLEILAAAPQTKPPTVVAPVYVRQILLAEPTLLPPIRLPTMHNLIVGAKDETGQPVAGALVVVQAAHWSAPEHQSHNPKKLTPPIRWTRLGADRQTMESRDSLLPTANSSVAVVGARVQTQPGRSVPRPGSVPTQARDERRHVSGSWIATECRFPEP